MPSTLQLIDLGKDVDFGSPPRLSLCETVLKLSLEEDEPFTAGSTLPNHVQAVFSGCVYHTLGPPASRDVNRHRYFSAGLKPYALYAVADSELLQDFATCYPWQKDHWKALTHYVFVFADETLEVISKGFYVDASPS